MVTDIQYSEKHRRLYAALKQGDFSNVREMLQKEELTFVRFMDDYISSHGLVRQAILRKADIPVAVGYKYLTGAKRTKNRNTILRLCIAMGMPFEDVQQALNLYGMSALGESDRDSIIATGIAHRSSVDEIDDWLRALSMDALMDSYDR